jgi:hypothetical protein
MKNYPSLIKKSIKMEKIFPNFLLHKFDKFSLESMTLLFLKINLIFLSWNDENLQQNHVCVYISLSLFHTLQTQVLKYLNIS